MIVENMENISDAYVTKAEIRLFDRVEVIYGVS